MMSAARVEELLARLYVDAAERRRFGTDPTDWARRAGLTGADAASVASLDPRDLELAARSFAAKRGRRAADRYRWWRRWGSRLFGAGPRRTAR